MKAWEAKVPLEYNWRLDDFPPAYAAVADRFLDGGWSMYITGGVGSRKSSFAVALMREWLERGFGWPVMITANEMGEGLRNPATAEDKRLAWATAPLLVVDDIGRDRATEYIKAEFLGLLGKRWPRHLPTVVTSNLSIQQLSEVFDDPAHRRLASRLEQAMYMDFGSKDWRQA